MASKGTKPGEHIKARIFVVEGNLIKRKNKICPKCGPGTFLGEHQNRFSCGRCNYTEFKPKANALSVELQQSV